MVYKPSVVDFRSEMSNSGIYYRYYTTGRALHDRTYRFLVGRFTADFSAEPTKPYISSTYAMSLDNATAHLRRQLSPPDPDFDIR